MNDPVNVPDAMEISAQTSIGAGILVLAVLGLIALAAYALSRRR